MTGDRLDRQLHFILEIDKLKSVLRRTLIAEGRRENSAEHSWQLAMMALLLNEYANEPVDILRVVKMALVHDVVEIDAGDTFLYDEAAQCGKLQRERRAAERIFRLLPEDQAAELQALWEEFEQGRTAESRFAQAIDRLAPLLLNYARQGRMWREHNITAPRVLARNEPIQNGSVRLWEYARQLIADAVARRYLSE